MGPHGSEMAKDTAKQENLGSARGILINHILGTFDLVVFKVIFAAQLPE